MPSLHFLKEGRLLLKRSIDKGQILIGRDPNADIQLLDPDISRKHCLLEKENEEYVLHDISRNGTLVNGRRITTRVLNPHDRLQIGPWECEYLSDPLPVDETIFPLREEELHANGLGPILGNAQSMQPVFHLLQKGAACDIPVCLIGESGTGKELAARILHDFSSRHPHPFVTLNCGAIPSNLIESLLFGHERGSFTGASERQIGLFEQANEGTLFLDEIGEMPLDLQTRLLRVLETKSFRRIGSKQDLSVDFRLVTATNKDLKQEVSKKLFRSDLFYRLFVFPIFLPPLRKRMEDITLLAEYFLKTLAASDRNKTFSNEAIEKLKEYSWPGNVRELKNVIQRALLLSEESVIGMKEIDLNQMALPAAPQEELRLDEQEKISILSALKKSHGNFTEAASYLGIARTTLTSKLRRYKMKPAEWS